MDTLAKTVLFPKQSYGATVRRVVDGDTFDVDLIMGSLSIASLEADIVLRGLRVRLLGCNAAEKSTEAGKAAKANLEKLLTVGMSVTLTRCEPYKYGGFEIVAHVATPQTPDLVADLVKGQWVAPWDGKGTRPTPPWPRTVTDKDESSS